jgi:mono/diheme cytochrome c family protein
MQHIEFKNIMHFEISGYMKEKAMERWKFIAPNLLLALIILAPSMTWSAQPGEEKHILKIYGNYCVSCHGSKIGGGKASPLGATGHAWHHPDGQIFLWIKNGRQGPAQRIPSFGKIFTAEEICGLIRLVKNWWTNKQHKIQRKGSEAFDRQENSRR